MLIAEHILVLSGIHLEHILHFGVNLFRCLCYSLIAALLFAIGSNTKQAPAIEMIQRCVGVPKGMIDW